MRDTQPLKRSGSLKGMKNETTQVGSGKVGRPLRFWGLAQVNTEGRMKRPAPISSESTSHQNKRPANQKPSGFCRATDKRSRKQCPQGLERALRQWKPVYGIGPEPADNSNLDTLPATVSRCGKREVIVKMVSRFCFKYIQKPLALYS